MKNECGNCKFFRWREKDNNYFFSCLLKILFPKALTSEENCKYFVNGVLKYETI